MTDLWGVCAVSDFFMHIGFLAWDEEAGMHRANRKAFDAYLRSSEASMNWKGQIMGVRTLIRAQISGLLAGPIAEQIFSGDDVFIDEADCGFDEHEDTTRASGLSMLLPWRCEFNYLAGLTERMLRTPDVWARVTALAHALELRGDMDDVDDFLPAPIQHWPPSPRSARATRFRNPIGEA